MPFTSDSINKKQHLNLSSGCYDVITSDMFAFNAPTLPFFLNAVFSNFKDETDMSISLTLNKLSGKQEERLEGWKKMKYWDESTARRILDEEVKQKEEELKEKALSYEKGVSFKFSLNEKNFEYLSDDSECNEQKYYSSRGAYIKAVIEEYSLLPFSERERVYFKDKFDSIEKAIEKGCQLKVTTGNGLAFSVYPYKVLKDPLSTTNYLVGYSIPYNEKGDLTACSFKIATIKEMKAEKSKSCFLSKEKKTTLDKMIESRGVQFLLGKDEEITVKLTEAGIVKFQRQVNLRPQVLEKNGSVYVFNCTEAQAEFYFFKFGKDAEIISPPSLREKFISMYQDACKAYN